MTFNLSELHLTTTRTHFENTECQYWMWMDTKKSRSPAKSSTRGAAFATLMASWRVPSAMAKYIANAASSIYNIFISLCCNCTYMFMIILKTQSTQRDQRQTHSRQQQESHCKTTLSQMTSRKWYAPWLKSTATNCLFLIIKRIPSWNSLFFSVEIRLIWTHKIKQCIIINGKTTQSNIYTAFEVDSIRHDRGRDWACVN